MKKDMNVNRYEKEIIATIDTLKELVRSKNMRMINRALYKTINDIAALIKLYKEAIEDELTPPK